MLGVAPASFRTAGVGVILGKHPPGPPIREPFLLRPILGSCRLILFLLWTGAASFASLAAQSGPLLQTRRDLRIDGNAADLSRIVHLAVAPDGTIIVVQPDDHHLRFYSPEGKELGRFGRGGEGPGEFRSMGINSGWVGGAFWQGNFWPPRAVIVGLDRRLQRTAVLPPLRPATRLLVHTIVGVQPNGDFIIQGTLARTPSNPAWARSIADSLSTVVLRVDSGGTIQKLLAVAPQLNAGCDLVINGRQRPTPECMQWHGTMSPAGERYVWVQPRVARGGQGSMRVTAIRTNGDTIFARDLPLELERISSRQSDSIRKAEIAAVTGELLKQDYAAIPLPAVFRPVHGIVAGSDGRTWIALRQNAGTRQWLVLGPTGSVVGRVAVPDNVRIVVAGATHIWGIETDADGVQSVVRYRVG